MTDFVSRFMADPRPRIELYTGAAPIFDHFGVEAQIDANLGRKVWLKSGGYLIVDQSEALTAIDVNTGRYVGKRDLEETDPQDEPRGREGDRLSAPLPEHRRPHHPRPHRHGVRRESGEGLSRAPGSPASGQGEDQHPEDHASSAWSR